MPVEVIQAPTVYEIRHRLQRAFGWSQTAKLAYHTYPLPDAVPPRLVPLTMQADLKAQELRIVKDAHFTKTDKITQTLIAKCAVFVVTFQPGTDVRGVLQIKKVCHSIIQWE